MIAGVMSDNLDAQLDATTKFRKLLSKEKNPPIERVIACGIVPRFVEFLRSPHSLVSVRVAQPGCQHCAAQADLFAAVRGGLGAHEHCVGHVAAHADCD